VGDGRGQAYSGGTLVYIRCSSGMGDGEHMGVILKSPQHVAKLRDAGKLVAETYEVLREWIVPGVSTADLDRIAEEYITRHRANPVYKGYNALPADKARPARKAFPASICVAVNEVICHGIPSTRERLQDGDIIGIDIGLILNGWVGDSCATFAVGNVDVHSHDLLQVTEECLRRGIAECYPGKHLGDIGAAIQGYAEGLGYAVVSDYVGHGVGRMLHEGPNVPHLGEWGSGLEIRKGMVFTIEPMINLGAAGTRLQLNGWTVVTADGSRSAQFEHQIAITGDGPQVLTQL